MGAYLADDAMVLATGACDHIVRVPETLSTYETKVFEGKK